MPKRKLIKRKPIKSKAKLSKRKAIKHIKQELSKPTAVAAQPARRQVAAKPGKRRRIKGSRRTMPSVSQRQADFMARNCLDPDFAELTGMNRQVACDFHKADVKYKMWDKHNMDITNEENNESGIELVTKKGPGYYIFNDEEELAGWVEYMAGPFDTDVEAKVHYDDMIGSNDEIVVCYFDGEDLHDVDVSEIYIKEDEDDYVASGRTILDVSSLTRSDLGKLNDELSASGLKIGKDFFVKSDHAWISNEAYDWPQVELFKKYGIDEVDYEEIDEDVEDNLPVVTDPIDNITMDVPLFIRMLEFAKEDAATDMVLHSVTEKAIKLSKERSLSMEDYDYLVSGEDTNDEVVSPTEEAPTESTWMRESIIKNAKY